MPPDEDPNRHPDHAERKQHDKRRDELRIEAQKTIAWLLAYAAALHAFIPLYAHDAKAADKRAADAADLALARIAEKVELLGRADRDR